MVNFVPQPSHEANHQRAMIPEPRMQEGGNFVSAIPSWPKEVMTGAAGRFAQTYVNYLETPEAFLFMGYLTFLGHLISDKITLESEIAPQPRLYTVLLGESADTRKSTAITKCHEFFQEVAEREVNPICGVGSAEGLAIRLNRDKRIILILDELHALVQKCKIDGSTLLPCVGSLFENDFYQNETSRQSLVVQGGQLCLLGASTLETYETMFSPHFLNIGFINRLFVVIGESRREFAIPRCLPDIERRPLLDELRGVINFTNDLARHGRHALPITPEAEMIFKDWYCKTQRSIFGKRLDTYGLRLMTILAVNRKEDRITAEVAAHTVALLDYQIAARSLANPIQADTRVARIEERIRRLLGSGPLKKRVLEQRGHKNRAGTSLWNQAINNLLKDKEIAYNQDEKFYTLIL